MLKKIFLFSLCTISIMKAESSDQQPVLYCVKETENLPIEPAVLKFTNPELNTRKFDSKSGKPALQQFLEQGFTYADLETPYREMALIRANKLNRLPSYLPEYLKDNPFYFDALYPHRCEVPSKYARALHAKLVESDLLAAAVYREIMFCTRKKEMTVDLGPRYGFFRCGRENGCTRFSHKEIAELLKANPDYKPTSKAW